MLPSTTNKLLARWPGLYAVLHHMSSVTYEIDMHDFYRKYKRIFHVNMLQKWHSTATASFYVEDVTEIAEDQDEVAMWRDKKRKMCQRFLRKQQLLKLLEEYADVLQNKPGRTTTTECTIENGGAHPVR